MTDREPQIFFRIPFTLYWLGRLPYELGGHKFLAIFTREFDPLTKDYYWEKL